MSKIKFKLVDSSTVMTPEADVLSAFIDVTDGFWKAKWPDGVVRPLYDPGPGGGSNVVDILLADFLIAYVGGTMLKGCWYHITDPASPLTDLYIFASSATTIGSNQFGHYDNGDGAIRVDCYYSPEVDEILFMGYREKRNSVSKTAGSGANCITTFSLNSPLIIDTHICDSTFIVGDSPSITQFSCAAASVVVLGDNAEILGLNKDSQFGGGILTIGANSFVLMENTAYSNIITIGENCSARLKGIGNNNVISYVDGSDVGLKAGDNNILTFSGTTNMNNVVVEFNCIAEFNAINDSELVHMKPGSIAFIGETSQVYFTGDFICEPNTVVTIDDTSLTNPPQVAGTFGTVFSLTDCSVDFAFPNINTTELTSNFIITTSADGGNIIDMIPLADKGSTRAGIISVDDGTNAIATISGLDCMTTPDAIVEIRPQNGVVVTVKNDGNIRLNQQTEIYLNGTNGDFLLLRWNLDTAKFQQIGGIQSTPFVHTGSFVTNASDNVIYSRAFLNGESAVLRISVVGTDGTSANVISAMSTVVVTASGGGLIIGGAGIDIGVNGLADVTAIPAIQTYVITAVGTPVAVPMNWKFKIEEFTN